MKLWHSVLKQIGQLTEKSTNSLIAQQKGETLNYVVPDVNISIDNPIAVVDKNLAILSTPL